jgi:hypothetical protein
MNIEDPQVQNLLLRHNHRKVFDTQIKSLIRNIKPSIKNVSNSWREYWAKLWFRVNPTQPWYAVKFRW